MTEVQKNKRLPLSRNYLHYESCEKHTHRETVSSIILTGIVASYSIFGKLSFSSSINGDDVIAVQPARHYSALHSNLPESNVVQNEYKNCQKADKMPSLWDRGA